MKKTKALHSISFKISSRIAIVITVIMAAICVYLSSSLTSTITAMTREKITLLADDNARVVTEYLNTLQQKSATLGSAIQSYSKLDQITSKTLIQSVFNDTLSDPRLFGVYVAFEPDKYYTGTPDGYSFYAYHSDTGGVAYELYSYADYKDGEYYTATRDSLKPEITEPYTWTLKNGKTVSMISISTPMLDKNGVFIGIVKCDISVDTIADLQLNMGGYQSAYGYLLTNKGNYVVHSTDKAKAGTMYNEAGKKDTVLDAAVNGKEAFFEDVNQVYGGTAFKVQVPVTINGTTHSWSNAFVVNKTEALKSVTTNLTSIIVSAVGGIVLLVAMTSIFIRTSIKPVRSLVAMAADIERGKLTSDIRITTKDELGNLYQIFSNTISTLNGYVSEISKILDEISDGNLTGTVNRDYEGDFKPIKNSLLLILSSLNETFENINSVAEQVSDGSSQVSSGAQMLASGATEQASTIEQLTASLASVSAGVKRNAENVNLATVYIAEAGDEVNKSNDYMASLLASMQTINESSSRISAIIKIIDDISFQTNILALNAAVEAARAGQAGKGFSVVAEEVRNLASKSANAAKQTSELINASIAAIKEGMRQAESTAASLQSVSEKAELVVKTNDLIREASDAQAQSIEELELGLSQVSSVVQTISATAQENAAASQELSAQAQALFAEASKFNTNESAVKNSLQFADETAYLRLTD